MCRSALQKQPARGAVGQTVSKTSHYGGADSLVGVSPRQGVGIPTISSKTGRVEWQISKQNIDLDAWHAACFDRAKAMSLACQRLLPERAFQIDVLNGKPVRA